MTAFTFTIQTGEVLQVLRAIESNLEDPSVLMKDVLLVMIRSTQLTFEAGGRPSPWAPLAESTERARFRKAISARGAKRRVGSLGALGSIEILRDTGLLLQSVGGQASGPFEAADGFGIADRFTAVLGTNRPGADALQLGAPEHNLPERPFLLFQDQDEEDIATMSLDFMLGIGPYAHA